MTTQWYIRIMAASTFNPQRVQPMSSPNPGFEQMSDSSLAASPLASVGFALTLLYIVLLVGRTPEITTAFIGSSFYQVLIVTLVLLSLSVITGLLVKVGSSRIGATWIAFHLWVAVTLPLSGYRRGSAESATFLLLYLPAVFFLGGFLIQSSDRLRKGVWAMAGAGAIGTAWALYTGISADDDERFSSFGSFSNPNILAIYLLTIIPFWGYIVRNERYRWATRLFFAALIGLGMVSVLRTGSRSGMLSLGVLFLIVFLSTNVAGKLKFTIIGALAVVAVMAWMPSTLKSRLGTVFSGEKKDFVAAGAVGSSESRYALLVESVETTFKHPIVGVGIGVYAEVNGKEKEGTGEKILWQVTHNMFTQVSAETGLPGFALYMLAMYFAIRSMWRVLKAARGRPELRELGMTASTLLVSLAMTFFNGLFTSMAFEFTIYVLLGFAVATLFVFEDVVRRRLDAGSQPSFSPVPRSSRFFPTSVPRLEPVTAPAANEGSVKNADAPWRRNPRKYPPQLGAPGR